MPVPDFQSLTLPVLREYSDTQEHTTREIRDRVAAKLALSKDELAELLPSGRQTRYANRIAWAHVYMKQAGLLRSPRRGVYQITGAGSDLVAKPPDKISVKFLTQCPGFTPFGRDGSDGSSGESAVASTGHDPDRSELTPDEQIRAGYRRLREALAAQLLERLKQASSEFFEELVVRVLVAMGYGGSAEDAARVVGRSGDGGIDGIIKEDRLGLENIYVQAKRWEASVGRPQIQQFAGALQGQRARKGVFITTSAFTKDAIDYAKGLQNSIVLVDGERLAELMIEFGVAVSEVQTIRIVKIDEDAFLEE